MSRYLIRYCYIRRWCAKCRRETRQRYATASPGVVAFLTVITCGFYVLVMLWEWLVPPATRCVGCGTVNRGAPCAFQEQQWGDQPNQYAKGKARPPE